MGTILILAGGTVALVLLAAMVSASVRLGRHLRTEGRQEWKDEAYWLTPVLCACGALSALAGLGIVRVIPGAVFSVALLGVAGWLLLHDIGRGGLRSPRAWVSVTRTLWTHARASVRYLREDMRRLTGRGGDVPAPAGAPPAAPAGGTGPARTVPVPVQAPSVRDDPALGEVPAPAEVAEGLAGMGIAVPAAWAALCDSVASFEPDTDEELLAHVAGEAAGVLTYGDAVRARAETLLHGVGVDPAYVAGHMELADEITDLASAVALVDKRFHAIYGALREAVDGGLILPHNARQWFGADGAAPQQDAGPADEAAA